MKPVDEADRVVMLTVRERQIVEHAERGLNQKQIATKVGISNRTVQAHMALVMVKYGTTSLLQLGYRRGMEHARRKNMFSEMEEMRYAQWMAR